MGTYSPLCSCIGVFNGFFFCDWVFTGDRGTILAVDGDWAVIQWVMLGN